MAIPLKADMEPGTDRPTWKEVQIIFRPQMRFDEGKKKQEENSLRSFPPA
jgi:hypothetical protein